MILDSEQEERTDKFIGAWLPIQAHQYLVLYTLARGKTKSKAIKEAIAEWVMKERSRTDDSTLIEKIIHRVNTRWKATYDMDFSDYKAAARKELFAKGLPAHIVKRILSEIKE